MTPNAPDERARGVAYAVSTYLAWGLLPIYFKALRAVPAVEVLAHRIVWSALLVAAILAAMRGHVLAEATLVGTYEKQRL